MSASPGWWRRSGARLADRPRCPRRASSTTSSTPVPGGAPAARELLDLPGGRGATRRWSSRTWPRSGGWRPGRPAVGPPRRAGDRTARGRHRRRRRELDEEFRRPRLARAVIELLAGILRPAGLLCVDDAHFMDEASADLFAPPGRVAARRTVALVVSRRARRRRLHRPRRRRRSRLDLGPLAEDAAWSSPPGHRGHALPRHQLDAIVERSGGNPLFLRELVATPLRRWGRRRAPGHHRRRGGRPHRQSLHGRPVPAPPGVGARAVVPVDLARDVVDDAAPPVATRSWAPPGRIPGPHRRGRRRVPQRASSGTAPMTGCRSVSVGASTTGRATPSGAGPGRWRRPSPSCCRSTTSTGSGSTRRGRTPSWPPSGPRPSTPTSRPATSTNGPSRPAAGRRAVGRPRWLGHPRGAR